MGKVTSLGSAGPDDPIYTGGPEVFSRRVSKPSSSGSAGSGGEATPPTPSSSSSAPKASRKGTQFDLTEDGALKLSPEAEQRARLVLEVYEGRRSPDDLDK